MADIKGEFNTEEFDVFMKRLIRGAHDVNFRDVVKSASGNDVLEINGEYLVVAKILKEFLTKNLPKISDELKKNYVGRANEVSNFLEPIITMQLNSIKGINVTIPTIAGRKQSAGYPDRLLQSKGLFMYLEIKTFQEKTEDSSFRTFYYKPSENNKITLSCPHLLIGFEVESLGTDNRSPFIIKKFNMMDLFNLKVSLKPEFNASNPMIYQSCKVI